MSERNNPFTMIWKEHKDAYILLSLVWTQDVEHHFQIKTFSSTPGRFPESFQRHWHLLKPRSMQERTSQSEGDVEIVKMRSMSSMVTASNDSPNETADIFLSCFSPKNTA